MIVSLKWLRSIVDIPLSVQELADRLTMVGLEIDAVQPLFPHLEGIVTARVERVMAHPKADRLRLCEVSAGESRYRVVCGAPNVREGVLVPLALPGATLPNGLTLTESTIRGEKSQGMLCSQKELELGEDASGIWILDTALPVGVSLREALGLDDVILEIGITPNRGDCLSMIGVAREVAAICGTPLRYPKAAPAEGGPKIETLGSVAIEDPVGCPRYAARLVDGVTIGPSPAWLRERLEAVGLRSINNIVDVTNFIMMELGQPLHAFDFDRLREQRIVVRRAREGERFTTLDGVERTLFDDTLMICDGVGPVAIAGIMGGLESEITAKSTRVLIESAYFEPTCIRRSSRKLGLRSESSYRFERGIDPEGTIRAVDRAAMLMQEVGGGTIPTGCIDVYPAKVVAETLTLRVDRTNRFLGLSLSAEEMAEPLRAIEMRVEPLDADRLQVVPPTFRPDITREVDLTEEVARLVGYGRIPVTNPRAVSQPAPLDPHLRLRQEVKDTLSSAGFSEVINYSFIGVEGLRKLGLPEGDPRLQPIAVRNPLSEDQAVMRTSLVPGVLQTVRYNLDHKNEDIRFFELSKVFLPRPGESLADEPHHFVGALCGRRNPNFLYGGDAEIDYADAKGVVEGVLDLFYLDRVEYRSEDIPPYFSPWYAAAIVCGERHVGTVGRVHPQVEEAFDLKRPVYLFELDFEALFALRHAHPLFRSLPRYPAVARDMAIVVDEGLATQAPLDFIDAQQESLIEQVEIFDIYRNPQLGAGQKSIGYRIVYRASDRSLTDEEVNAVHSGLVRKVLDTFNATLR